MHSTAVLRYAKLRPGYWSQRGDVYEVVPSPGPSIVSDSGHADDGLGGLGITDMVSSYFSSKSSSDKAASEAQARIEVQKLRSDQKKAEVAWIKKEDRKSVV